MIKHGSYDDLVNLDAKSKLKALDGDESNNFDENTWIFYGSRCNKIKLDFNSFSLNSLIFSDERNNELVYFVKKIWIEMAVNTSPSRYLNDFNALKLFFKFLDKNSVELIDHRNIDALIEYFLFNTIINSEVSVRLKIRSYCSFSNLFQVSEWKRVFNFFGYELIARDITVEYIKSRLKKLIGNLTDNELTYLDWYEGGSLNRIDIDRSKYYVEHTLTFYEKNYALALSLSEVYRKLDTFSEKFGLDKKTCNEILNHTLSGRKIAEIERRHPTYSVSKFLERRSQILSFFYFEYKKSLFESEILKDDVIMLILNDCGVESSANNIDRLKVVNLEWIKNHEDKVLYELLKNFDLEISIDTYQESLKKIEFKVNALPDPLLSERLYSDLGVIKYSSLRSNTPPRQCINMISKAALTSLVALTGWRRSEFDFPFESVNVIKNSDKLDQYSFPFRYNIDWYVYKTSGRIKVSREITFSIYLIIYRLYRLNVNDTKLPCLYAISNPAKPPRDSVKKITQAVPYLWENFVNNYEKFIEIDNYLTWKRLNKKNNLTIKEKKELERILEINPCSCWDDIRFSNSLLITYEQVRGEWEKIKMILEIRSFNKKNWLLCYRSGEIEPKFGEFLDSTLSDEIKLWLDNIPDNQLTEAQVTSVVKNSVLEGLLYPTPHSFRHNFAEFVYRRFDGDIGWMIRSQFKHISKKMWTAYIRDKDNRLIHEDAKNAVASRILRNYFDKNGTGYSGKIHKYLRRLTRNTKVLTYEEQVDYIERFSVNEIENIKANPWGYCLLKRRTRSQAKCASMGEPLRHNASLNDCLGCTHNLIQESNIDWLLLSISTHIDVLNNPEIPDIFRRSSYAIVKKVASNVKLLKFNHESLPELEDALSNY